MPLDDLNDRQLNIIKTVETLMLEGVMTWENYNKDWGIEVDLQLSTIKTKLFRRTEHQWEVTEEMIQASKETPPPADFIEAQNITLNLVPDDSIDAGKLIALIDKKPTTPRPKKRKKSTDS